MADSALDEQAKRDEGSWRGTIIDLVRTAAEVLALFLILSLLIGRFEIHQVSMEPNLLEGERVIVSKLETLWPDWLVGKAEAAGNGRGSLLSFQRGQIVVLQRPDDRESDPLIKRVVGLPGETVEIREGEVFVDGRKLAEPYTNGQPTTCSRFCGPLTLGAQQYFVMGDNRPHSLDSRAFGPVGAGDIIGRVVLRYGPLNKVALYW